MDTTSVWFNIKSLATKISGLKSNGFALSENKANHPSLTYTNQLVYTCADGIYSRWTCNIYINEESGNCSLQYSKF
jgi:hypothetical protein